MIQTLRPIPGPLTGCPQCDRQPKHCHVRGRDLHSLECPPCGLRTARLSSFSDALTAWEDIPRARTALRDHDQEGKDAT